MKRLEWFMMLVGALTFILPRTGFAQKSDKEELPLYWMDEIVVTATRTEKAIKDLSATVSVITREEIEASNAHSCMDILNTLPGLFVQRTGAFGRADVEIRGIAVEKYENDLAKITDPGTVVEIAAAVAAAGNPGSYMKRRFGH